MLSKRTKYGIKALVYLARKDREIPTNIAEISNSENISRKFLESILLTLKKRGILGSKKGKKGGYYLIKESSEVKMSTVFRVLEGPIAMVSCVSLNFYEKCDDCPNEDKCTVNALMREVRDSALEVLNEKTLADLV